MSDPDPTATWPFRLLVVCTANICRSVMAERMLRRDAAMRRLDIEIESCGLLFDGEPASSTVVDVMRERGLDVRDHHSRRAHVELLEGRDLIVTMERMHARELTVMADGAPLQIHTLGAVVEWLGQPHRLRAGASPEEVLASFAEERRARDLLGFGPDEVPDPHGRSKRVHRRTADRLEVMGRSLLDGLFASRPERATAPLPPAAGDGTPRTEAGTAGA